MPRDIRNYPVLPRRLLGVELLAIIDKLPADATHDRELVDAWAAAIGMTGWYTWIPYKP